MNPPLPLWYMCKYCMIPFFTFDDLNSHKELLHSEPKQPVYPCERSVAQDGHDRTENESESTNLSLDNKYQPSPSRASIETEYIPHNNSDNTPKSEDRTAELFLQPQQQETNTVGVEFSILDLNFPGISYNPEDYSALGFDLSMLKSKPEPHDSVGTNPTASLSLELEAPGTSRTNEKRKKSKVSKGTPKTLVPEADSSKRIKQKTGISSKSSGKQKLSKPGLHFAGSTSMPQHHFHSQPEHQLSATTRSSVNSDGDTVYQCRFCFKQLAHKWSLNRHERKHSGVKRFRCQFCQKPIDDKCALQIHERTHTGERPFKCKFCESTFSRLSSSKRHEQAHLGIRPKKHKRAKRRR